MTYWLLDQRLSGCQKPFGKASADMTFLCTISQQARSPPPPPPPASRPLIPLDHARRACACAHQTTNPPPPSKVPSPHPSRSVAAVSICLLRDGCLPAPPAPPLLPSYSPSQFERVLKCLPALCNTDTGPQHTDEESGLTDLRGKQRSRSALLPPPSSTKRL